MKTKAMIQFGLKSINTDEFATVESTEVQGKNIQLDHSFTFSLNNDMNEIAVSFKINFKSEERPFIILRVSCVFNVNVENLLSPIEGNKRVRIPKDFMTHLAFLTTGTARGVLHSKLESTQYNRFLLPIIDVSKSFKDDVQFDLLPQTTQ